jgi:hypothetical protein
MTEREQSFDISDALQSATDLITAARAELIQTLDTYDSTGPALAKTALERVQELNDPTISVARTAAAAGLTEELPQFGDFWIPLKSEAGWLLYALANNLMSLGLRKMSIPFPSGTDDANRDPIAIMHAYQDALTEARQRNELIDVIAVVAEQEVAETVQEVSRLLTARLNLLVAFIHVTDPTPGNADVPPGWFASTVGKAGVKEAVLLTAEEILRATIKEGAAHVPVAGIIVSVINVVQDVREKRQVLRERREHQEAIAKAYRKSNATDDMSNLLAEIQQDNETIKGLFSLIDDLIRKLQPPPEPT